MLKKNEIEYEKYVLLIKKRAKAWARRGVVGLEQEDLESIGAEAFLDCVKNYDPTKSKFSTFLWKHLNFRFNVECNFRKKHPQTEEAEEQLSSCPDYNHPESCAQLKDTIQKLSEDARFVVNSALNTPMGMIKQAQKETGAVHICKKRIQRYLIDHCGWGVGRCWRSFAEIRKALQ